MQTISRKRLAFLGGGVNSAIGKVHFISSQMDQKFVVTGGCFSRHSEVNLDTATQYQLPRTAISSSLEELLSRRDEYDAIVLLTPTPNHFEHLQTLLDSGIRVICEKSLVASYDEALKIHEKVVSKSSSLAVTFNYTGYPMVRLMQEMLLGGQIGDPISIRIEMPQEGYIREDKISGVVNPPQTWRQSDGEIPTILLDLGVHVLHLASFITNLNPSGVFARFRNHSFLRGVIDDVEILSEYTNGMLGSYWVSKTALGKQNGLRVEIYGTKGSLAWVQVNPNEILHVNRFGENHIIKFGQGFHLVDELRYTRFKAGHPGGFIEAFANLYSDIHEQFVNKVTVESLTDYVPGIQNAVKGLEILRNTVESNRAREWIPTQDS